MSSRSPQAAPRSARARLEESLILRRKVARAGPGSATAQLSLALGLFKLGFLLTDRALLREALDVARALERAGQLPPEGRQLLDLLVQAVEQTP